MTTFGLGQLMQTTPTIVKRLRDMLMFIIAGSLAFVSILAPKFHVNAEDFAQWAGLLLLLVRGISMFFGVPDEQVVAKLQDKINQKNAPGADE